jgi:MFS family permease
MNSTRAYAHSHPAALALGGAIALASAMGIGRFAYTPILPEMAAALHLTAGEAGLIASANFAGYLVGALVAVASFFAPRRRGWMLAALLVSALTTAAMAATASSLVFMLLRFLGGFASAFALVFTSSLVLDRLLAAERGHMAGHQFAGVGAGIVVSAILVAQLAAHRVAWQWQWIATGLLSVLAVAAVAALIPARRDRGAVAAANGTGGIGRPLAALVLAYGLFGFGYVITATFLVQLVRTSAEMAPIEPFIWVIVGLASMPSVAFWAAIGRRIGLGAGYALACLVKRWACWRACCGTQRPAPSWRRSWSAAPSSASRSWDWSAPGVSPPGQPPASSV